MVADDDPPPPPPRQEAEAAGPATPSCAADHISSLPDHILASIISLLPLKQSVQISILFPRWRHLWTLAPLHIDMDAFLARHPSAFDAVTRILSLHRGPIRCFRLLFRCRGLFFRCCGADLDQYEQTLDSWARALAQQGIQDVAFNYRFPPHLLTCESLRSLELMDCHQPEQILALPPNLRELKLMPDVFSVVANETKLPPGLVTCQSLHFLELNLYCLEKSLEMPLPANLRELTLCGISFSHHLLSHVLSGC